MNPLYQPHIIQGKIRGGLDPLAPSPSSAGPFTLPFPSLSTRLDVYVCAGLSELKTWERLDLEFHVSVLILLGFCGFPIQVCLHFSSSRLICAGMSYADRGS